MKKNLKSKTVKNMALALSIAVASSNITPVLASDNVDSVDNVISDDAENETVNLEQTETPSSEGEGSEDSSLGNEDSEIPSLDEDLEGTEYGIQTLSATEDRPSTLTVEPITTISSVDEFNNTLTEIANIGSGEYTLVLSSNVKLADTTALQGLKNTDGSKLKVTITSADPSSPRNLTYGNKLDLSSEATDLEIIFKDIRINFTNSNTDSPRYNCIVAYGNKLTLENVIFLGNKGYIFGGFYNDTGYNSSDTTKNNVDLTIRNVTNIREIGLTTYQPLNPQTFNSVSLTLGGTIDLSTSEGNGIYLVANGTSTNRLSKIENLNLTVEEEAVITSKVTAGTTTGTTQYAYGSNGIFAPTGQSNYAKPSDIVNVNFDIKGTVDSLQKTNLTLTNANVDLAIDANKVAEIGYNFFSGSTLNNVDVIINTEENLYKRLPYLFNSATISESAKIKITLDGTSPTTQLLSRNLYTILNSINNAKVDEIVLKNTFSSVTDNFLPSVISSTSPSTYVFDNVKITTEGQTESDFTALNHNGTAIARLVLNSNAGSSFNIDFTGYTDLSKFTSGLTSTTGKTIAITVSDSLRLLDATGMGLTIGGTISVSRLSNIILSGSTLNNLVISGNITSSNIETLKTALSGATGTVTVTPDSPETAELVGQIEIPGLEIAGGTKTTTYTVKFYVEDQLDSEKDVTAGSNVSRPENPTREGYTFLGWYKYDSYTSTLENTEFNFESTPIDADTILVAKWQANTYTVTFELAGGSITDGTDADQTVTLNGTVTEPTEPTKEGHTFLGWYKADGTEFDFATDTITENTTLTAKWEVKNDPTPTYTVTFDLAGGTMSDGTAADQTVTSGGTVTKPTDPTKEGHTFLGWYKADGTEFDFATDTITENTTLTAKWEEDNNVIIDIKDNNDFANVASTIGSTATDKTITLKIGPNVDTISGLASLDLSRINVQLDPSTKIKTIASNAFKGSTVTDAFYSILSDVTSIGDSAFEEADLTSIEGFALPTKLTEINSKAFKNTEFVESVSTVSLLRSATSRSTAFTLTIPNTVISIGANAFEITDDSGITPITIDLNTTSESSIGSSAFSGQTITGEISIDALTESDIFVGATLDNLEILGEINDESIEFLKALCGNAIGGTVKFEADDEKLEDFNTAMEEMNPNMKGYIITRVVTFDLAGGSITDGSDASQTVTLNGTVKKPTDPTKEGYTFLGWYKADGTKFNFDTDTITEDTTLTAKWEPKTNDGDGEKTNSSTGSGAPASKPTTTTEEESTTVEESTTEEITTEEFITVETTTTSLINKVNLPTIDTTKVVSFNDVSATHWASSTIEALAKAGIINGDNNGNFNPTSSSKRADVAIMLVNLLGLSGEGYTSNFNDVSSSKYYAKYVGIAKEYGIVNGSNGNFNPEQNISRQDTMVMIANILKQLGVATDSDTTKLAGFSDYSLVSDYAKESVAILINSGIIVGDGGNINPKSDVTRAELSVIIYKVYDLLNNQK